MVCNYLFTMPLSIVNVQALPSDTRRLPKSRGSADLKRERARALLGLETVVQRDGLEKERASRKREVACSPGPRSFSGPNCSRGGHLGGVRVFFEKSESRGAMSARAHKSRLPGYLGDAADVRAAEAHRSAR